MITIHCDVCKNEMHYRGIQQAERTVIINDAEVLLTIRAEADGDPDVCNLCIIRSLQGVDDPQPVRLEPGELAWCGHTRKGKVQSGPQGGSVSFTCCDLSECKERLIAKASEQTGESAYFYRDTIGG